MYLALPFCLVGKLPIGVSFWPQVLTLWLGVDEQK
jgi:hypothetical protein